MLELYLIGLLLSTIYASKTMYDNTINYNTRYTRRTVLVVSLVVLMYPLVLTAVVSFYLLTFLAKAIDKFNDKNFL